MTEKAGRQAGILGFHFRHEKGHLGFQMMVSFSCAAFFRKGFSQMLLYIANSRSTVEIKSYQRGAAGRFTSEKNYPEKICYLAFCS